MNGIKEGKKVSYYFLTILCVSVPQHAISLVTQLHIYSQRFLSLENAFRIVWQPHRELELIHTVRDDVTRKAIKIEKAKWNWKKLHSAMTHIFYRTIYSKTLDNCGRNFIKYETKRNQKRSNNEMYIEKSDAMYENNADKNTAEGFYFN